MTERTGTASDAETTAAVRRGTNKDGAQRGRSDVAVDTFRGVVVVMMFAVHARRIQAGHGDGALEAAADVALRFLMRIEPYIAASFLYLVGFSLLLSWSASASRVSEAERPELARRWRARMLKRAAWLYALSVGLCLPQFGLQWPATFVSSGILSVIALAIVCCATLLTSSGGRRVAWPLCVLVLLVTSGLHFAALSVSGINAGPGGTFPLLAASLLGMQSSSLQRGSSAALAPEPPLRAARLRSPWTLMCLAIAGYELLRGGWDAPWTDTFSSHYRDYGPLAAEFWLEHGPVLPNEWVAAGFWNHTSLGLMGCVLAIWFTHQLLHALFNPSHGRKARIGYKPFILCALGEHALLAYIAHLIALGLVEMLATSVDAALVPSTSLGTWLLVGSLVLLSLMLASLVRWVFLRRLSGSGT